jgi:8-amino-7-oxononanoate synthase
MSADAGLAGLPDDAGDEPSGARAPERVASISRRRAADGPADAKPLRRETDHWLDRWLETVADLTRLKSSHPMLDAVIDEVDGRMIRVGDQWLADFASCNYLGFDLDREIIEAVPEYLDRWGTHPSWSRLLGSPVLYEEIEQDLTDLLACEDTLALPTITHIHMSVIPVLTGAGTIFLDQRAHKTIYDGCSVAAGHGATIHRYRHNDPGHLDDLLRTASGPSPRVICMDGVNSMTGNWPDLRDFAAVAAEHDALLYVDDAHGFGVVGERTPDEPCPYGTRGNSLIRYFDLPYDNVLLVAGMSKSYSSLLSFLTCPTRLKEVLKVAAPPYLYSGPSPVASLATSIAGLRVNAVRGDAIRAELWRKTRTILDALEALDVYTPNESGHPIVEIPLANHEDIDECGRHLFDRGIYTTLAAYPLVPKAEVGFRVQVTAVNTDEQIDRLCEVLAEVTERFALKSRSEAASAGSEAAREAG